jgi:hypothetical protein
MGQTNRQRVKEWREKKSKEGGRSLSIWMEPEIAKKLDEIKETAGESTSLLVARAIAAFHDVTCNDRSTTSAPLPATLPPEEKLKETVGEIPPVTTPQERSTDREASITCNDKDSTAGENHIAAIADSIADVTATFRNKRDFTAIRERLAALLRLRIENGEPFSALMEELNKANLPTPGGEKIWRRSTIFALLR